MERLSIFDMYKIGVGPSSSHTLGPWKAARAFAQTIAETRIDQVEIHLYGSLSKTGIGHATDLAVQLGLEGYQPEYVDTSNIQTYIDHIKATSSIQIGEQIVSFIPQRDIIFHQYERPEHPNTLTFHAYHKDALVATATYCSVGGGFIEQAGTSSENEQAVVLPYPIDKGSDLLHHTNTTGENIAEIVYRNELHFQSGDEVKQKIQTIFDTMLECVYRGCTKGGILPGGLKVKRRAKALCDELLNNAPYSSMKEWLFLIQRCPQTFKNINKWISCFALAVNEENASLGRVVTSPTNGAAGVVPAVLLYYYLFHENKGIYDVQRFFLASGEIGCMFKKGATISAAVGGCQAEIGVSSAMAAGGLTEVLGGTPEQVLMAAEIAMEHHLGLTCDPIGGLVQIPCIERNAMGAIKAITASNLALSSNPKDAKVTFDIVVKTMWDTAQEMNTKYKETSEGGLAYNLPVIFPEC